MKVIKKLLNALKNSLNVINKIIKRKVNEKLMNKASVYIFNLNDLRVIKIKFKKVRLIK